MIPESDRFGYVKLKTIRRDFDKLREAIKNYDPEATEEAWLRCERWLEFLAARNIKDN